MNNKYEEYDGYEMPENQGFATEAEREEEFKTHQERMEKIKKDNNIT
ncbi:MAG: hypothetical protein ACI4RU_00570 [Acutalibacteraceae bacterium]